MYPLVKHEQQQAHHVEYAIEKECSDDQNTIEKECSGDKNDRVHKKKGKLKAKRHRLA